MGIGYPYIDLLTNIFVWTKECWKIKEKCVIILLREGDDATKEVVI